MFLGMHYLGYCEFLEGYLRLQLMGFDHHTFPWTSPETHMLTHLGLTEKEHHLTPSNMLHAFKPSTLQD
jgi:hypothetical protein